MLKILRKCPIPLNDLSQSREIQSMKINPKYIRTVLDFDGSMTKLVMNLSQGENKPLIQIIQENERDLTMFKKQQNGNKVETVDTLTQLPDIFGESKYQQKNLIQRSIKFYLVNSQQENEPKLLYFARSFWNKQKYEQIMSKSKTKPIGLNLIQQQVELFRKLNWTGICDLQVTERNSSNKDQRLVYKDLCSRSYSMINSNQPLCELQEFFLPQMFDIFSNK